MITLYLTPVVYTYMAKFVNVFKKKSAEAVVAR